jgi:hypothetical protein
VGVAAARGLKSTGQAAGGGQRRVAVKNMPSDPDWFAPSCIEKDEDIAGKGATMKFTSSMARFAEERGAKVIVGALVGAWSMKILLRMTGHRLRGGS